MNSRLPLVTVNPHRIRTLQRYELILIRVGAPLDEMEVQKVMSLSTGLEGLKFELGLNPFLLKKKP